MYRKSTIKSKNKDKESKRTNTPIFLNQFGLNSLAYGREQIHNKVFASDTHKKLASTINPNCYLFVLLLSIYKRSRKKT